MPVADDCQVLTRFLVVRTVGNSPSNASRRSEKARRSQGHQCLRGFAVEVAAWYGRVGIAFPSQVAPDIATVLEQQGVRIVLRVTLEEDEQAIALFDKRIDAGLFATREQRVAAG